MSRESLEAAIAPGARIVLDTSVVLSYLDGSEAASPAAAVVIDGFVRSGRNEATISAVTVAETLVHPFRAGTTDSGMVEDFLQHFPNLEIRDVGYAVAAKAARLRAATNLRTADALVIATAVVGAIPIVVANDSAWHTAIATAAPEVQVCHLDAHLPIER